MDDEGLSTTTSIQQKLVEANVQKMLTAATEKPATGSALVREQHIKYLLAGLKKLSAAYSSLDASKPWLCYWTLHSLDLLESLPSYVIQDAANYLKHCQSPTGGFGGGPGQLPHLAATYAATNALAVLGAEVAYAVVDREKMYNFLLRMKQPDGSFVMQEDGEVDVRASYCALSVATMLNICSPLLIEGVAEFIGRCQTYEGGMGGYPGNEAHGGYTFCSLSALILLNRPDVINVDRLIKWAANCQMSIEGGFQGRTNKLVDSCYSFWQGALFPLIHLLLSSNKEGKGEGEGEGKGGEGKGGEGKGEGITGIADLKNQGGWLFEQQKLQKYILFCCQDEGGLRDKPGKNRDYYHTCYALSGLSMSQNNPKSFSFPFTDLLSDPNNILPPINPMHNVREEKVQKIKSHFAQFPPIK